MIVISGLGICGGQLYILPDALESTQAEDNFIRNVNKGALREPSRFMD